MVFESAEQERGSQHEQYIGYNRSGDGCLDQYVLPGAQGGQGNYQLGQIAQRGVEQAADVVTGFAATDSVA